MVGPLTDLRSAAPAGLPAAPVPTAPDTLSARV